MISKHIKEARLNKRVSMRQAAHDMGFPYMTYVNYEKGVSEPNSENLVKIANYYNVMVDFLVGVDHQKWEEEVEEYNNRMISDEEKMAACLKGYVNDDYVYIVVEIIRLFSKLNKEGLLKAKERVEELSWVPNYQSFEYKALLEAEKQKIPRE